MHKRLRLWPLPLLGCLGAFARAAPAAGAAAQPLALTVVQTVSKAHSLAGTAPASPSWSPSGEVLAFSWNDRALPAREIWLVDREGTAPRRLTHASEQAGGAMSEFVWMRDGRSIVYLAGGDLYPGAAGGGTPQRPTPSGGEKGALGNSPGGRVGSFLRPG